MATLTAEAVANRQALIEPPTMMHTCCVQLFSKHKNAPSVIETALLLLCVFTLDGTEAALRNLVKEPAVI